MIQPWVVLVRGAGGQVQDSDRCYRRRCYVGQVRSRWLYGYALKACRHRFWIAVVDGAAMLGRGTVISCFDAVAGCVDTRGRSVCAGFGSLSWAALLR